MEIQREVKGSHGAFFVEQDGKRVAEQTFSAGPDGKIIIIDHTEVDESLHGQGMAKKLTEAAVLWARAAGVKIVPLCPFAKAVFEREPSFRDVLAS